MCDSGKKYKGEVDYSSILEEDFISLSQSFCYNYSSISSDDEVLKSIEILLALQDEKIGEQLSIVRSLRRWGCKSSANSEKLCDNSDFVQYLVDKLSKSPNLSLKMQCYAFYFLLVYASRSEKQTILIKMIVPVFVYDITLLNDEPERKAVFDEGLEGLQAIIDSNLFNGEHVLAGGALSALFNCPLIEATMEYSSKWVQDHLNVPECQIERSDKKFKFYSQVSNAMKFLNGLGSMETFLPHLEPFIPFLEAVAKAKGLEQYYRGFAYSLSQKLQGKKKK